jgi:hypothetical protein
MVVGAEEVVEKSGIYSLGRLGSIHGSARSYRNPESLQAGLSLLTV